MLRQGRGERVRVTAAEFTFVALDESGRPRPIPHDNKMSEPHSASSSSTEAA